MNIWKAVAVLAVVLGLIVAAIWALVQFSGITGSLIWTAIIAAIGWAIRNSIEQKREHLRLPAEKKRAHYFEFLDYLNTIN